MPTTIELIYTQAFMAVRVICGEKQKQILVVTRLDNCLLYCLVFGEIGFLII